MTSEEHIASTPHQDEVKWFTLIEIKVAAPFVAKGFLAAITSAIAKKDLNVLVVSTFSKDYILVREEATSVTLDALRELGFPISFLN